MGEWEEGRQASQFKVNKESRGAVGGMKTEKRSECVE